MCNLYSIGKNPNTDRVSWEKAVREALRNVPKVYGIRPTDPGLVVRTGSDGGVLEASVMRWGFKRPEARPLNNSRGDKLGRGIWARPFRENRCLVVADCFYEWTGPPGQKRAHAFARADQGWMWIAGIWEENEALGPCYSMITTAASGVMTPIHHRMPAVLDEAAAEAYLQGEFAPEYFEETAAPDWLLTLPCENPLKMSAIGPPIPRLPEVVQGDLFGDAL